VIVNWSPLARSMASRTRASAIWEFSRHLDQQHAIQVRLLGLHPMCLGREEDEAFYDFAEMATRRSRSRYIRVATSGRRSGHLIVAGETSVSAYKERHAKNTSWYSNRGICRIYCDGPGRHGVTRVGAAAV
jgi:hypothetical protein